MLTICYLLTHCYCVLFFFLNSNQKGDNIVNKSASSRKCLTERRLGKLDRKTATSSGAENNTGTDDERPDLGRFSKVTQIKKRPCRRFQAAIFFIVEKDIKKEKRTIGLFLSRSANGIDKSSPLMPNDEIYILVFIQKWLAPLTLFL